MSAATVSTKGQIVIPSAVRAELGIEAGSRIEFVKTSEGWLLKPAIRPVTALKGIVPKPAGPVSIDDMRQAIRRHAGKPFRR